MYLNIFKYGKTFLNVENNKKKENWKYMQSGHIVDCNFCDSFSYAETL